MNYKRQTKKLLRWLAHLPYRKRPGKLLFPLKWYGQELTNSLQDLYRHRRTSRPRTSLLVATLIIILLGPLAIFLARTPPVVEAGWWNEHWTYRKIATITNSGSTLTDYQASISLDTASLISASKMRADCGDIRLTNTANQPLTDPYYIESCNSAATKIWIKFASLPAGATPLNLYYGNSTAQSTASPGEQVFDFFDDFNGTTLNSNNWDYDGYEATNPVLYSVADGYLNVWSDNNWRILRLIKSFAPASTGVVETKFNISGNSTWHQNFLVQESSISRNRFGLQFESNNLVFRTQWNVDAGGWNYSNLGTLTAGTWYIDKVEKLSSTQFRGSLYSSNYAQIGSTYSQTQAGWSDETWTWVTWKYYASVGKYDWIRIRQSAATEPTVSFGSEETGTTPVAHYRFDEGFNQQDYSPSLTGHETQINILDRYYTKGVGGYGPTDNSLGIFYWDADKYPGATVYFEAVIRISDNYSNNQGAQASLFTTAGSQVTASALYTTSTSFARIRSGAITLTDDTNYTIRINATQYYSALPTAYIKSAKLIIVQTDSEKITTTQTSVELGEYQSQTSSTYSQPTNPKIYKYDSSKFTPSPTSYFEAAMKSSPPIIEQHINIIDQTYSLTSGSWGPTNNSLGMIYWDADKYPGATVYLEAVLRVNDNWVCRQFAHVGLFNSSGTIVSGSDTSTCSTTFEKVRSGALTLTDNTNYSVRIYGNYYGNQPTAYIQSAKLIIIQTDATKITDTQAQVEIGNNETTTSTSYTALTDPKYYLYDTAKFSTTPTGYFEASLSNATSSATAYAALYTDGAACSAQVSGSEVSVTGTTWTRVRSSAITLTDDAEYSICIKADADTARIANAKLILDQSDTNGITATQLIHDHIITKATDADSTYTSQDYYTRFNPDLESTQVSFGGGNFSYFFEATLNTPAGTASARLYDTTSGAVTNSEVSTTSTSYTRVRSAELTSYLPSFPTIYAATTQNTQLKNSATNTTSASSSRVIVDVTNLTTSGPATAYAELYDLTASTPVTDSEVSTTNTTPTRIRSSAITLTSDHEYAVRTKTGTSTKPIIVYNAKLILDQSDPNGLKAIETLQPMVNAVSTDSDATYTTQYFTNYLDKTKFSGLEFGDAFFEATLKTSAGTGYAQLSAITQSEVSTTSASYVRTRSTNLKNYLTTTSYDTQIKNSATNTTSVSNSSLIIQNVSFPDIPYGVAHNSSTNALHALIFNDPVWSQPTDCHQNRCLSFSNTDNYGYIVDNSLLDFAAADSFTINLWFKHPKATATHILLSKFENIGTDGGYQIYLNSSGKIVGAITDADATFPKDSVTSQSRLDDNRWHHLAFVKNGASALKLYIDGNLNDQDLSLASTGTLANNDGLYLGIANDKTSSPFYGSFDELKVYRYARSEAEIKTDYNGGTAVQQPTAKPLTDGLVAHWKLDETASPAVDSSGNGNTAAWQGNTASTLGKFGNAVDLDGTGDHVSIQNPNSIPNNSNYRIPITITNSSASLLTNYQVRIAVTYDSDMNTDFSDLTFTDNAASTIPFWLESKVDGSNAVVWVKVPSIPASGSITIYMNFDGNPATSQSSLNNTFAANSIFHITGAASDSNTSHAVSDTIRQSRTASSTNYVTSIDDGTGGDNFFRRYRFLFVPTITGTYDFGTNSDDGSEIAIFPADGYGGGYNTTHPFGAHTVVGSYYGPHGTGTCGTAGIPGSAVMTAGQGYWLDFVMTDTGGGQYAQACIKPPSGSYSILNTTNFPNQFYSRSYTALAEPTISIGSKQIISEIFPAFLTISAWINADTLGSSNRTIIARGSSNTYSWAIYNDAASPGKLKFTSDGTNFGTSNTTLSTDTWHHLSLTVSGTTTKLFINGVMDAVLTNTGVLSNAGDISVGADADGTDGWDGKIDDVRIYNRALTAVEMESLYSWSPPPQLYFSFDEALDQDKIFDHSGNGNDGALNGGLGNSDWVAGQFGKGLKFDGNNDHVSVANTLPNIKTLSFWVKPTTNTESLIALNGSAYVNLSGGTLSATGFSPTFYVNGSAATTLAANTWQHVVATSTAGISASAITIGLANSSYFDGYIDEVKLYDYVRNSEEIIADYNAGHPSPGSPLGSAMIHFKLDEGLGTTANNSGGSPSILGTITSGTWTNSGKFNRALSFTASTSVTATITDPGFQNTISLWLKPTTSAASKTLVTSGKLTTDASSRPVYGGCVGSALTLSQWTHLVAISDSTGACRLYQNGIQTASGTTGVSFGTSLNLGGSSFTGQIDDFKLYPFGLDDQQVKVEFNQGKSVVFSAVSTEADGKTLSFSGDRQYCIPGDTTTCNPPIARWQLDENSGTTIKDTSGVTTAGTISGTGSHWAKGKFGSAVALNGTDDAINLGDQTAFEFADGSDFTISLWFKSPLTASRTLLAKKAANTATNSGYMLNLNSNGSLSFFAADGTDQYQLDTATGSVTANVWTHVTVVYDDSSDTATAIYLNGQAVATTPTGTLSSVNDLGVNSRSLKIGSESDDQSFFIGTVDDIRLYNYVRTPAQVAWGYNQGGPTGWWKFNDCSGTTAHDSSGNNFSATVSIGATGSRTTAGICGSGIATESWDNGVPGLFGSGIRLDGTDDVITAADNSSLRFDSSAQDFSLTVRFKRRQTSPLVATGGTVTELTDSKVHTFTSNGSFVVSGDGGSVEALVVAGGGGGGGDVGGGGGGGGVVYDSNLTIAGGTYTVTIGNGGSAGNNGQNSVFSTITATGGGGGGVWSGGAGKSGGSGGGGGGGNGAGGSGTSGQGYNGGNGWSGYASGSGGGAGAAGTTATSNVGQAGGIGYLSSITGTATYYAGGGGGGGEGGGGAGGLGGGGDGAARDGSVGESGTANTGGGGGGTGGYWGGSSGGSGIVIIRYSTVVGTYDQEEYLVSKEDADDDGYRLLINADNTVTCSLNSTDVTSAATITDDNWHQITCVVDRDTNLKLYLDGVLVGTSAALSSPTLATTANLTIGTRAYTPTSYFTGLIDDVRVYNYALTPAQIQTAMNNDAVVKF